MGNDSVFKRKAVRKQKAENENTIPSPEALLFGLSISLLLLGFDRVDLLAKVISALTRDIVILKNQEEKRIKSSALV